MEHSGKSSARKRDSAKHKNPAQPERDVLGFLMQHAPLDESWEADVLGILREEAYYFLPQMETKIMNEGWASYWHSRIMTEKALRDDEVIDYADVVSGVFAAAPGQLNPYKLGVELYRDIERRWNEGKFGPEWDRCDNLAQKTSWDKKLGLGKERSRLRRLTRRHVMTVFR